MNLQSHPIEFIKREEKLNFSGNSPLFEILGNKWTIGDACEGVQIFGGTGSGKTSGSGKTIAKTYLARGFGGLVLTVKAGDAQMWNEYSKTKNISREEDLIIVDGSGKYKFNFLDYLVREGYNTTNICHVFLSALQKTNEGDYWQNAMKQLLKNTINLLITANGTLSVQDINKVIFNAPKSIEESNLILNNGGNEYFLELINKANISKDTNLQEEFRDLTYYYWINEFPAMDSEPRSSIISMLTCLTDNLLRGEIKNILSCKSDEANFSPEDTFDGRVIILDLNIKKYRESGKMTQLIFKTVFQMAIESKREEQKNKDQMRPVFLWIDEAQFFLTSDDVLFQTTARSCKVCSVYLTQNYSNYLAFVGSSREKATVDAFLSVLQTKFFHCQSDPVTNNDYFSKLIGKDYITKESANSTHGIETTKGTSTSKTLDYKILPWELDQLKKGGEGNNFIVEAIVYQSGRIWQKTGTNFGVVGFLQV